MSIGKKLALGFAVVLLLTLGIGYMGSNDLVSVNQTYQGKVVNQYEMMEQSDTLISDLLQVRRSEKDFLMRKDMKYVERVNKYLAAAQEKGNAISNMATEQKVKDHAMSINEAVNQYRSEFAKLADAVVARGLSEKEGVYGEFRKAAHNVEDVLKKSGYSEGEVLYLTLRRHEKDYMLRGTEKYLKRADETVEKLKKLVVGSYLALGSKAAISAELEAYSKSFHKLVEKDAAIAALLPVIKKAADHGMELAEQVEAEVSTALEATMANVSADVASTRLLLLFATAISLVLGSAFAFFTTRSIVRPLKKTVDMIQAIGAGDLDQRLDIHNRKDEIGVLAKELNGFAEVLQDEVLTAFEKLADGDLTFEAQGVIREPLKKANAALNEVMGQIQVAGEQIDSASGQVADSSQTLSQGATETAASLEEIGSSLSEVASQSTQSASNADTANVLAENAKKAADDGSQKMQSMVAAMAEISESGQNISKIIKTIDEIAFQTNLLALNAAVEAARAGQHGKGFAVVAEEVRNLAARSAKAAEETSALIEGSIEKTENGSQIATETSSALEAIVTEIVKVTDLIGEIAAASNEQAQGITQINQGLGQIDQAVQKNTATSEESAAAAEELSSQAAHLKQMLSRFVLSTSQSVFHDEPVPHQVASSVPSPSMPHTNWGGMSSQEERETIQLDDSEFGRF